MSKILIGAIIVCISALILACGVSSQSLDVSKRSRNYAHTYERTFKAIIDYCTDAGFPVSSVDKDLGLVNTDWKGGETMGLPMVGSTRTKIAFSLRKSGDNSSTTVVVNLSIQKHGVTTWTGTTDDWADVTTTEGMLADAYMRVFSGIDAHLK